VRRVRCPIGVIAMIYEARPAVTIDAFALCFKAGNAAILKGGKEADEANQALAGLAHESLAAHGLPAEALVAMTARSRDDLRRLLGMNEWIDLVIPRGGESLIRFVASESTIPTVQHYHGVCHAYVHAAADLERAVAVCVNAKASAPATCNALECVLVDRAVADRFVPMLAAACADAGIEVRGDEAVRAAAPGVTAAGEADYGREFLDLILATRVVDGIDEAIAHIERYGSSHTDAILTRDDEAAEAFTRRVQSSCVLVNASTRFNDGFELGLGAEIGISTQRVHAFGPMGLEELTVQRYVAGGDWLTR
jgi:glutamate-5-semialdehyde dehydrogenase